MTSPVAPTSLGQFLYNPAGYDDFPGPANNVTNANQKQVQLRELNFMVLIWRSQFVLSETQG